MNREMEWMLFWTLVVLLLAGSALMAFAVLTERYPYP